MNLFDWIVKLVKEYWPLFLNGTKNTLIMALTGTVIGFIIGLGIAIIRTIPEGENMHPALLWIKRGVNLVLNAYVEIVRGGIMSIDKGQFEGAHAIGMNHFQTMYNVILPQAVKNIMPSIGNEFVVNIKDSSVLSIIAITELMFVAKQAGGTYAKPVPSYIICALIYFVLTFTVTRLLRLAEKKLSGSDSYTICGSQSDPDAEIHIKGEGAH